MDTVPVPPTAGATAPVRASGAGVVVASSESDAAAVDAVVRHHAELAGALATHVDALLTAVGAVSGNGVAPVTRSRGLLVDFCTDGLLPHAAAEEAMLYPAVATDQRAKLLVEAMLAEHRVLEGLVEDVRAADSPIRAAAAATALRVLFDVHLAKESDLILPLVAADPTVSLSAILAGMHELLGVGDHVDHPGDAATAAESRGRGACGCSAVEASDHAPVLDVRNVPHAIRHATVFGAVGAVPVSGSLVLIAPHDPLPLLGQLEDREPGAFNVSYDQRGPDAWPVRLTRTR
ncbi:MAG TPA: DUF2249 domain-containing protein [Actinomycetes bacterium]